MNHLLIKTNLKNPSFLSKPIFNILHFSSLSLNAKPHFITQYLINSCGFSQDKARKISKRLSHLLSSAQPDSVMHFLKHHNFTNNQIKSLISGYPSILSANVDNTLKPNLEILLSMDFPDPELRKIITSNPRILVLDTPLPRLSFWLRLLDDNKKNLLATFKRNRGLINHDIDNVVKPKMKFLKSYGLSEADIGMIAVRGQRFITRSVESMEEVLRRANELGFNENSAMFGLGVSSLSSISGEKLEEKIKFYKGYGWSKEMFLDAFKKAPMFVHLKEANVKEKMEFLVGKVGCEQSYIADNPLLLMFSLEKRLKPRCRVMEMLKKNELGGRRDLSYVMSVSNKFFVEKLIGRYKDKVPDIHEIYDFAQAHA